MDCPYQRNMFCATLSAHDRKQLCACCRVHSYHAGKSFSEQHWTKGFAVLVEGLVVVGRFENPRQPASCSTTGIGTGGEIISLGPCLELDGVHLPVEQGKDTLFILDSAIAFFPDDATRKLYTHSHTFVQALLVNVLRTCVYESDRMLMCHTAKDSVRYALTYTQEHCLPHLTHEQIALIANTSRPTATIILHELAEEEPELFRNEWIAADGTAGR